ncbi:MAG: Altered inheritance of mitochondria protein 18 mitochondrial [Geoglossum simile]|nr:MAG: Altered inheritance of mitochondria protein 18 mitochondrial [Geoglossum simile]
MPLLRKRRAVEENISDEESEVTPPQRRQRQPAAAPRQQRRRPLDEDGDRDGDNSDGMGLDVDAVVEDGATQGPGGSTADQLAKKMVRLALACEFSRQPIRRADISAKGPDGRRFKQVFEEAQKQLRDKFGMEMTELPIREKVTISQRRAAQRTEKAATTSKTYVLTSTLPPKYRSMLPPPQAPTINLESSYIGLYTFLVSVISLSGGSIAEAKLERYLKRTNADQYTPVDKTEKLLHRLCKEGYLMRIKESSGGEEVVEYMVGPRGKVEVGSGGVAGLVRGVYGESATEDLDARIWRSMGLNEKTKKASGREGPQRHGGDDARNAGGQRRNIAGRGELEGSSDED